MGIDFEVDEVWEISYNLENSDEYNEMIKNTIQENFKTMGREI